MLIHHGPLPEAGPVFRRRCPYLVLTEFHLIQFKSQSRASEMFPGVPGPHHPNKTNMRHSRLSSSSSIHDLQSSSDGQYSIPLVHIVAVYKLDDGEPYFSIEIAHFNDSTNSASTMTLQIHDPGEADAWLTAVRSAASKARATTTTIFPPGLIKYTARALEQEHDYNPDHFNMFKVVQRAHKSGKRSSSDDLTKLTSKICILAIGMYKIHLVPLPKSTRTASSTSLSDMNGASHGTVTLSSVNVQNVDDSFQLWFRFPFQPSQALHLAALCVHEIILYIRQSAEYLRPEWTEQPIAWIVPSNLNFDDLMPYPAEDEENRAFDRTLTAYCAGYKINTSNIRYTVNYDCEDAPAFVLLSPSDRRKGTYNSVELLAIFRALRYNETFHSISFSQCSLDIMNGLRDHYGWEHTPWTTRSGDPVDLSEQEKTPVFVQEIRALALKNRRLRRLDFSFCLTRRPSSAGEVPDSGCGICEALFPLCSKQYTNVDWITLNGILLSETDTDYLYAAAIEKSCHFRAIEVAYCGLADRSFQSILQALSHQGATLEWLVVAGNFARLEPSFLREYLDEFSLLRVVNFSNISRTSGKEPLFELDTLRRWKLQQLNLSRSPLNAATLQVLADYLRDPQSNWLTMLSLDQCALTGGTIKDLCYAMVRPVPRQLHLSVSDNHLEDEHAELVDVIQQSLTPTQLTMEMLEYKDEKNFQLFLQAWSQNTSTHWLNISKVSLPCPAGDETVTVMKHMLANNQGLQWLNISGEEAHLEVATFGFGLNRALLGLKTNKTLKHLHVQHQRLGIPGANTLATIIEENSSLLQLHCDRNGFNFQAFSVIVSSLVHNHTLQYLSPMEVDRAAEIRKWEKEVEKARDAGIRGLTAPTKATVSTVKRQIGAVIPAPLQFASSHTGAPPPQQKQYTQPQAEALLASVHAKWDNKTAVMQGYLDRNFKLAHGLPVEDSPMTENERPTTGHSGSSTLRLGSNDATPLGEPDRQLGADVGATVVNDNDGAAGMPSTPEGDGGDLEAALMMGQKLKLDP